VNSMFQAVANYLHRLTRGKWIVMPTKRGTSSSTIPLPGPVNCISVLVAEDHPMNQLLVRKLLERRGYRVTVAKDGLEVVRIWRASPLAFDVILMDIEMPRLDGLEATCVIRRLEASMPRRIPIIAHSSATWATDSMLCFSAGMNDSVPKTAKPHVLYEALERALPCDAPSAASPKRGQARAIRI